MTLREIAARLEALERRSQVENVSAELERLRLDIERHIFKTEGTL